MVPILGKDIREAYLDFFRSKNHKIIPSSSLIPEADPTLLLTNAGMNQFKPYFLGTIPFPNEVPYAVSCQKCFRTGDLEKVGFTARHHTFFEMLGNFSFGGYFKREAIQWAWEFVTQILQLDQSRIWVSVFQTDEESIQLWKQISGLSENKIKRLGAESNFWTMGTTGPCGPCSEIYVDLGNKVGCQKPTCDINCDCGRFLEIWNLVFTQYDRQPDGNLQPLPKPNIDTGMGLERVASVMQKVESNFETDLILPLKKSVHNLLVNGSREKKNTHAQSMDPGNNVDTATTISLNVISDHLRAMTFLIADGVLPSNEGRGYVLRRVLRRAVRHGKRLGFQKPFLNQLVPEVSQLLGSIYPEILQRQSHIVHVVLSEEDRFLQTLDSGMDRLTQKIQELHGSANKIFPGEYAFMLYDTYGFPLELTREVLKEEGVTLEESGFQQAMELQREKARSAWKGSGDFSLPLLYQELAVQHGASRFVGYEKMSEEAKVIGLIRVNNHHHESVDQLIEGEYGFILMDQTPFYAEKGGQIGDRGSLQSSNGLAMVLDTQMVTESLIGHWCQIQQGQIIKGQFVRAMVHESDRRATMRNHTATHLLHAALRQILGVHVEQAGSYVGPDRLRFDFTHFKSLEPDEIKKIEQVVNEKIIDNLEVSKEEMSLEQAKKKGALAFFSEKYGTRVRVIQVSEFSMELCGGTHVQRTGDIGVFKILSESSVAAGVRRVEAITGPWAIEKIYQIEHTLKEIYKLLKTSEEEVMPKLETTLNQMKAHEREIQSLKSKLALSASDTFLNRAKTIQKIPLIVERLEGWDIDGMRQLIDVLKSKLKTGVIVLGMPQHEAALFMVGVTSDLTSRIKAGFLVQEVVKITGGKGGGRPDWAQAGGKDGSKLSEALQQVPRILEKFL